MRERERERADALVKLCRAAKGKGERYFDVYINYTMNMMQWQYIHDMIRGLPVPARQNDKIGLIQSPAGSAVPQTASKRRKKIHAPAP